jgi:purine-binding chemotaxis protein CheW
MNDPRDQESATDALRAADTGDARGETTPGNLQQALRALGAMRAGAAGLTPDMLADLAQRAGLSGSAQVAELARIMGANGAGGEYGGVPQHIVFMLGDIEYALPAETVQGVERVADIAPVPNTVPWVLGIVHLRGSILSVVDLRGFLGIPAHPVTQRSRLLVVAKRDMIIGMVVDGVTEMRPLGPDQIGSAPAAPMPAWAAPYAVQAVNIDGRGIVVLDPERLLYAEKMHHYRADLS